MKSKYEDIKNIIIDEYKKGNIAFMTIDGLMITPLKEFIKQPIEGILYDLNRGGEVVLANLKDPKWINDYAVCKVITELKAQLDANGH